MPTKNDRLRRLVALGLLPATAQAIIDNNLDIQDRQRAPTWLYYSPRVPDRYRRLWDALPLDTESAKA